MQTNRVGLLNQLTRLRPGLSSKERVDQANSIVFGEDYVLTYNEHIMVISPLPFEDIQGAVRAEELLAVLGKLKVETIDLSIEDGQLLIRAGKAKSGIRFDSEISMPMGEVLDDLDKAIDYPMPVGLLPALGRARFCASASMNELRLTGIHVCDGEVTSTDYFRIMRIYLDDKKAKKIPEFLIPASAIKDLLQYTPTTLALTDSWAFFKCEDGIIFCVRLLTGLDDSFPDLDAHLKVEGPELIMPKAILEALDKADIFTKSAQIESERVVEVSFKKGRITVRGAGDFGFYEENIVSKDYVGEPLTIFSHPEFLRGILPEVQNAIVGENLIRFDGDDFVHVFVKNDVSEDDGDE